MSGAGDLRRWSVEEKLHVLEAWAKAVRDGFPTRFLEQTGVSRDLVLRWHRERADGVLRDDPLPRDGSDASIAQLARDLRSILLQANPRLTVSATSLAGPVVYDQQGHRRLDYLARARAALRAVTDAVEREPEAVLSVRGVAPKDAIAAIRRRWGVDALPEDAQSATSAGLTTSAEVTSTRRRLEKWDLQVARHDVAREALSDWLVTSPYTAVEADSVEHDDAPLWWDGDPMAWPPRSDRPRLLERTFAIVGPLKELEGFDQLKDPAYRTLAVLRRRIAHVARGYVQSSHDAETANRIWTYLNGDVVRPWLPETRDRFQAATGGDAVHADDQRSRRSAGAVIALCAYDAMMNWSPRDTEVIVESLRRTSADPARAFRSTIIVAARPQKLAELKEKEPVDHWVSARAVSSSSPAVLRLFQRAEELRDGATAEALDRYLDGRASFASIHSQISKGDKLTILFADLIASLAVANRRVARKLDAREVGRLRGLVRDSAHHAHQPKYGFLVQRDLSLTLQGSQDGAAVTRGRAAIQGLRRDPSGGTEQTRRHAEVEQQLALVIAGSSVQLLESRLSESARQQQAVPREEWVFLATQVMHFADLSLKLIQQLHREGDLRERRFESRYLSDESMLFRAHEMYYRCACAAATAVRTFGGPHAADFPRLLREVFRATVQLNRKFTADDMGRLLPTMIWHAFLVGGQMPALQYSDNPAFFDYDPMIRKLAEDEIGSDDATTKWGSGQISVLTTLIIRSGKHFGPLGMLAPDSEAWKTLQANSEHMFGTWRDQFGEQLRPAD